MNRKSFLIWGLVIISLAVISHATLMYLSISKIIDVRTTGSMIGDGMLVMILVGFGLILHLRFKTIGRRKRVLALCLPFWIVSGLIGALLMLGFITSDVFGAHGRYFDVILEWSDPALPVSWTTSQRLDYILLSWAPAHYLSHWGLFALLAFGSLDPRKPSKNRVVQFLKTGFQRKVAPNLTPSTARPQEIMA